MKKNLFLTGAPSAGKTTVIRRVIESVSIPANGFYTEEERVDGKRVGFLMKTLDGKEGYLAHQEIQSDFSIRRYGVSIENVETIAVPSIVPVANQLIILDEIAKMECFSSLFRDAAIKALNAPNVVLGTIAFGGDDFILGIKERGDIEIIEVTPDNRDSLPRTLSEMISRVT